VGVLIDASVLIASERGQLDLARAIEGREEEAFHLSVVTASELLHGVHRARDEGVRARRSAFVERVIASFPLLAIDLVTARAHARLWAALAQDGQLIGPNDLWLAAACIARGLTIVTANVRELERVPGLRVERWG
jgi:tRNA(fMet)-specific endonuclease VapC